MEFQNLGERCTVPFCKQQDYLPFRCKFCDKVHCKTHAGDHNCSNSDQGDRKVILCPICESPLYYTAEQNPNELCDDHLQKHCDQKTKRKKSPNLIRCDYWSCATKLNNINKYNCKNCKKEYCGIHRMGWDHDCEKAIQDYQNERAAYRLKELGKKKAEKLKKVDYSK